MNPLHLFILEGVLATIKSDACVSWCYKDNIEEITGKPIYNVEVEIYDGRNRKGYFYFWKVINKNQFYFFIKEHILLENLIKKEDDNTITEYFKEQGIQIDPSPAYYEFKYRIYHTKEKETIFISTSNFVEILYVGSEKVILKKCRQMIKERQVKNLIKRLLDVYFTWKRFYPENYCYENIERELQKEENFMRIFKEGFHFTYFSSKSELSKVVKEILKILENSGKRVENIYEACKEYHNNQACRENSDDDKCLLYNMILDVKNIIGLMASPNNYIIDLPTVIKEEYPGRLEFSKCLTLKFEVNITDALVSFHDGQRERISISLPYEILNDLLVIKYEDIREDICFIRLELANLQIHYFDVRELISQKLKEKRISSEYQ